MKSQVNEVAKLAQIKLSSEEAEEFGGQLEKIFNYFEKLSELDTEGVLPLVTPLETELILRPDQVHQEQDVSTLLESAPETQGNLYRVPPVV